MPEDKVIPVRVAVRCRPLIDKEVREGCNKCVTFIPGESQLILGKDKTFTYDYVFKPETPQNDVYETAVTKLVDGIFKGYNATVLAYGQTGSGKTFSMGGGYGVCLETDDRVLGVIPRAIRQLFDGINKRSEECDFFVRVSYLEIYKEELLDLLVPPAKREKDSVFVREDINGGIKLQGLTEVTVENVEGTMKCLEDGSHGRTTGATAMNTHSSRSHAIFTIHIDKTSKEDSNDLCKSKFHLVDLAGSERAKKTNAEGERFREGVNINMGLLALGNVISALGEEAQKRSHIPYRDSKLTRLLQDSLGGNSLTLMIACISPADSNMEETLSTLRYADRARKIKNKPIVNRDPQAAEIHRLKQLVQDMQSQLYQGGGSKTGTPTSSKNTVSNQELNAIKEKVKGLEEENKKLSKNLQNALQQNAALMEKLMNTEMARDQLKEKLDEIREKSKASLVALNKTYDALKEEEESDTSAEKTQQYNLIKTLQESIAGLEVEQLSTIPEASNENGSNSVNTSLTDDDEFSKDHVQKLQKYQNQLAEIDQVIRRKEALASQMASGEENWDMMKEKYEKDMKEMEAAIEKLTKEKEQMHETLQQVKSTSAASKISEQRRKRLQELETQISTLRKKMVEQNKLLKMKEQTEKQLQKCNQEITAIKQQRVKLMKQMKEDNEAFRQWKQTKEKEVTQLKAKDRKREAEVAKLNRNFQQQQNVMKRKAAEAAAVNKRLQEALNRQKQAADDRFKKQEADEKTGIGARVRKYLDHEFEVQFSLEELRFHLNGLRSDRKVLSEELATLKEKLNDTVPSAKRRSLNDRSWKATDEEKEEIRDKIKKIEQDVEIRSGQISDIQERLVDLDSDEQKKTRERYSGLKSGVEWRLGIKHLMNVAVREKVDVVKRRRAYEELEAQYEAAMGNAKSGDEELEKLTREHDREVHQIKKECEEKVLYLLKQLNSTSSNVVDSSLDEDLKKRLKFQEAEIGKLSHLKEELEQKTKACNKLRGMLTKANYLASTTHNQSLMPDIDDSNPTPVRKSGPNSSKFFTDIFSPAIKDPISPRKRSRKQRLLENVVEGNMVDQFLSEEDTEEEVEADDMYDSYQDPDWERGFTPGISVQKTRRKTDHISAFPHDPRFGSQTEIQLRSESQSTAGSPAASQTTSPESRPYCKCRGTCSRRQCKCVKEGISCDDQKCGCETERCQNRELQLPESTTDEGTEQASTSSVGTLNTTFNIAYVDTASEVDTTSESKDSVSTSQNVLKDNNSRANTKKRSADGNATVRSYSSLFDSSDGKNDDSLKDFDTEGAGLAGLKKRKRKTLLNKGKSLFEVPN